MQELVDLAVDVARAAGAKIAAMYETDLEVQTKSSAIDLVTEADRAAEAIIVERLRSVCPGDAIVAEESGRVGGDARRQWLVDPLDGTTNFAHWFPHFSVSIALYERGEGLVGVVHDPLRDETFFAARGEGAWLRSPRYERRALHVTDAEGLGASVLATGFGYDRATAERSNLEEFNRLIRRVRGIRRAGSAALDMAYIAAGRLDGYWELGLSPWDWGAGAVLVREAGGLATTLAGTDWRPGDEIMVAAGPRLHPQLCEALRS